MAPETVALMLHKPTGPSERVTLCAMVEQDRPAFGAYQGTHPTLQERTLRKRGSAAAFVRMLQKLHGAGAADRAPLEILDLKREARVAPPMPRWSELVLEAEDLSFLPRAWEYRLAAWRGIYLIVDQVDGMRYVGSACGEDNLLGRWRAHVAGDHGVTRKLGTRKTDGFRFSILERLSPAAGAKDVVEVEMRWIERLDTRRFGLNA